MDPQIIMVTSEESIHPHPKNQGTQFSSLSPPSRPHKIPCLLLQTDASCEYLIYFHGNGEDMYE